MSVPAVPLLGMALRLTPALYTASALGLPPSTSAASSPPLHIQLQPVTCVLFASSPAVGGAQSLVGISLVTLF